MRGNIFTWPRAISFSSASTGIVVGLAGSILGTDDGGTTWTRLRTGLPKGRIGRVGVSISPANPQRVYAQVEQIPEIVESIMDRRQPEGVTPPALMKGFPVEWD